jgi:hypothetical protein
MAMTNELSSPALIPGVIPDGLLPPTGCGGTPTQQIYEEILKVTGVSIAAGQRGPQGNPGAPGPPASLAYQESSSSLTSGAQNVLVSLAAGERPGQFSWILVDPSDSATALSPAPAIAYFSLQTGTVWRVTFTTTIPEAGWILYRTKVINQGS